MAEAAKAFLDTLDDAERAEAQRAIGDEDLRRDWTYLPRERAGLALGDLDRAQRKAVHRLVAAALRPHAYAQVATIMGLEDVLDRAEGGRRGRHSTDYWTIVFGEPGDSEPWGWRFEGHHVSVNLTVAAGEVSATPCFLGANPATIAHAGSVVLRPLALEEELARALLEAMDSRCRRVAVISDVAPADIRTRAAPRVTGSLEPLGVAAADLGVTAAGLLDRLVSTYVDRLGEDLARAERRQLRHDELHFAWEGRIDRGAGHYYRIQGSRLLIEYDNTQNNANHIHTVWRQPRADFGEDLLARHYAERHAG